MKATPLGIAGRISRHFSSARLTPLLALMAMLLGVFAFLGSRREEEPQIDVTMANVLVQFPGASVREVVYKWWPFPPSRCSRACRGSSTRTRFRVPVLAVVTVQFKVGAATNFVGQAL